VKPLFKRSDKRIMFSAESTQTTSLSKEEYVIDLMNTIEPHLFLNVFIFGQLANFSIA